MDTCKIRVKFTFFRLDFIPLATYRFAGFAYTGILLHLQLPKPVRYSNFPYGTRLSASRLGCRTHEKPAPRFASSIVAPSKIEFARVRFPGRDSRPFLTSTKDSFRGGRAALTTRLDGCLVRTSKYRHWIFTRIAAWDHWEFWIWRDL